jgi:hypothetical protein
MDDLIAVALDRFLTVKDLEPYCGTSEDAVSELCNVFARRVVERYLVGDLAWADADAVMNHLFTIMTQQCAQTLPDYSWRVYLAFDEGEYVAPGGDEVTKPRLLALANESTATGSAP